MTEIEEWRSLPGYEGVYKVSNLGRVKSLARVDNRGHRVRERILSQWPHPSGHISVKLSLNGCHRLGKVHRLVLMSFVGPPPEGHEALHGDGNPANNRLENLSWGTRSENIYDRVRHGTHHMAVKTHCPQGHPYDDVNTYITRDGKRRMCRSCLRIRNVRDRARRAVPKVPRTHCREGHALSEDNVYTSSRGHRSCKVCAKASAILNYRNQSPETRAARVARQRARRAAARKAAN